MANVFTVTTIGKLKSTTGAASGDVCEVLGYYAAGDGGGGTYYYDAADTSSNDNGGSIIIANDSKRWKLRATGGFTVKQFGARGDDAADDTASIKNAIDATGAGTLHWQAGIYRVSAGLVQRDYQSWQGAGGQRATTIKKVANCDLVSMGDQGSIQDMNLECQGVGVPGVPGKTGRGICVERGFSQVIRRVRIAEATGPALDFTIPGGGSAGGGAMVSDLEATTASATVPAVRAAISLPSPQFFNNIWLSGGLFDFSGSRAVNLSNFYVRNVLTSSATSLVNIANGRFASVTDTTILSGSDISLTGVTLSGPLALESAMAVKISGCTLGSGFTEGANCAYNSIFEQRKPYAPIWSQFGGSPAIGNGTLTGSQQRNGVCCNVAVRIVMGSTTAYGSTTGAYKFGLPFRAHQAMEQHGLPAVVTINGVTYPCWATIMANEDFLTLTYNGQAVRNGFPATWSADSTIDFEFSYLVR